MRRLALAAVLLAALVTVSVPAGAATRSVAVRWSLVGTGPGARSLVIRYEHGACDGVARATATGTSTAIRIRVTRSGPTGGVPRACPQVVGLFRLTVHLRNPVGGRRIHGGTPGAPLPTPSGPRAVPRVLGLAPADARSVLAANGLGSRTTTRKGEVRLPQVVAQSPAAGKQTSSGSVRLVLSGH
jgi:hypothetical protein